MRINPQTLPLNLQLNDINQGILKFYNSIFPQNLFFIIFFYKKIKYNMDVEILHIELLRLHQIS